MTGEMKSKQAEVKAKNELLILIIIQIIKVNVKARNTLILIKVSGTHKTLSLRSPGSATPVHLRKYNKKSNNASPFERINIL